MKKIIETLASGKHPQIKKSQVDVIYQKIVDREEGTESAVALLEWLQKQLDDGENIPKNKKDEIAAALVALSDDPLDSAPETATDSAPETATDSAAAEAKAEEEARLADATKPAWSFYGFNVGQLLSAGALALLIPFLVGGWFFRGSGSDFADGVASVPNSADVASFESEISKLKGQLKEANASDNFKDEFEAEQSAKNNALKKLAQAKQKIATLEQKMFSGTFSSEQADIVDKFVKKQKGMIVVQGVLINIRENPNSFNDNIQDGIKKGVFLENNPPKSFEEIVKIQEEFELWFAQYVPEEKK